MIREKDNYKILFVCGGSGGHVNPALSTAHAIKKKMANVQMLFVTTEYEIDGKMFVNDDFERMLINAPKRPNNAIGIFGFLRTFFQACKEAKDILKSFKPDVIVGYGGYVQVPVIVMARLLFKPVIIHEQNVVPGLSNMLMSFFAKKIAVSHQKSKNFFFTRNAVVTGMPVRHSFIEEDTENSVKRKRDFSILIVGGSQGAHSLNMLVLKALKLLPQNLLKYISILHIAGEKDYKDIQKEYEGSKINATVMSFCEHMYELYENSDLVISRAGAGTLSEISICQLPSILVPYPYAGRHQYHNARAYVKFQAAVLCDELRNTAFDLSKMIERLIDDKEMLKEMGKRAGRMGAKNAAEALANEILYKINTDGTD